MPRGRYFIIHGERNLVHEEASLTEYHALMTGKYFWMFGYDFDRASSLICGNKMPTRCNRGFYCSSYCLLNMFRAPLCRTSGAQDYYTVVAACGIWCCGFQVVVLVWSWGLLCVRLCPVCRLLQHPANRTHNNPQLHTRPTTWKTQHEIPQAATTV